jgi:tripartite-type tricarboxylate transporter receptor subunit TctC
MTYVKFPHRRQFLHLAAGVVALPAVSRVAWAQAYPTRPVRIVVGLPPGGAADIFARLMGQWLSERLGQQFIIDNRPGAGTNIGTETVVKAPPDGHTLLLVTPVNAINVTLYEKLNFDFIRDITPIASVSREPLVMKVNPSFPAMNVPEFIAYAKANPGKINFGSGGTGSVSHVSGELFKLLAGVDMVHVRYSSIAPALTGLIDEQVQVVFGPVPPAIAHIRAGKIRALAVTTATRVEALPDLPSLGDFVPGYESSAVFGLGAPRNTPAEIVDKLNKEINAGLADPKVKARLVDQGSTPLVLSPTDFGKLIADETEKWGKVVRAANIKPG